MNFTEEDIKKAFRLGWNSTDKYAKQKGFPTNQYECLEYILKEKGIENTSNPTCCDNVTRSWNGKFQRTDCSNCGAKNI